MTLRQFRFIQALHREVVILRAVSEHGHDKAVRMLGLPLYTGVQQAHEVTKDAQLQYRYEIQELQLQGINPFPCDI